MLVQHLGQFSGVLCGGKSEHEKRAVVYLLLFFLSQDLTCRVP